MALGGGWIVDAERQGGNQPAASDGRRNPAAIHRLRPCPPGREGSSCPPRRRLGPTVQSSGRPRHPRFGRDKTRHLGRQADRGYRAFVVWSATRHSRGAFFWNRVPGSGRHVGSARGDAPYGQTNSAPKTEALEGRDRISGASWLVTALHMISQKRTAERLVQLDAAHEKATGLLPIGELRCVEKHSRNR